MTFATFSQNRSVFTVAIRQNRDLHAKVVIVVVYLVKRNDFRGPGGSIAYVSNFEDFAEAAAADTFYFFEGDRGVGQVVHGD